MNKKMRNNKFKNGIVMLLAFAVILVGSIVLPSRAAEDAYSTSQTLDAAASVAVCKGVNVNGVESIGVTFPQMGSTTAEKVGSKSLDLSEMVLISGKPFQEKAAFVVEFKKPIDANKIEYLTMGMFAGLDTKIRVYDSETVNFVEDTAQDILTFSSHTVEKKTLVLSKYADKDGLVRNLTFYIADMETSYSLMIDYFQLAAHQEATEDYVLKSAENTYTVKGDMGTNQIPTFRLQDQGLLKDMGWESSVYVDGSQDRILKEGRYFKFRFDKVNVKHYETMVIDFYTATEVDLTLYAYSADEMVYSEETVDQVVNVKGGEVTTITLDTAKFADEYGYVSEVNFLLAKHTGEKGRGLQVFLGDVTFRLPREYANVTVYTEKLNGGYEKSNISTKIEGMAGDKVSISPYDAEEIGLYGYTYNSSGKNVLSGTLEDGKVLDLRLYYKLQNYTVKIQNDGETSTVQAKHGTEIELMKYRKENMLMNITVDGLALEGTKATVTNACVIDIKQTPGNYIWFMIDDELYATLTYTPEDTFIVKPVCPVKEGYAGEWEEILLNGEDHTIHAIYTPSEAPTQKTDTDDSIIVNVANAMKKATGNSVVGTILLSVGIVILIAAIAVAVVILVRKGILGKRGLIIGGSTVAACCATAAIILFVLPNLSDTQKVDKEEYKFDKLYASSEEKTIKPEETLTFEIDKALNNKNYIKIDVDTDVDLLGTIEYYNVEDKEEANVEEFFIEAASEDSFYQFLDNFRENASGAFDKHLTKITIKNIEDEEGKLTLNEVGISDRVIDLTKAELYVENEYLKVGMDLICGGALTYVERLPQDGQVVQEIIDKDGNLRVGLNYGEIEGAELLSESVNLINIFDKGREIQQSFYADVNEEEHGYKRGKFVGLNNRDWPYNPVQGGDQDDNSSQIIDFRVEENELYVKTRAMDWGQHNVTTKSYMENWYTLNEDMLYVKNRFIDWNGFENVTKEINNEMPAVYIAQALNTFVTYDGTAPWTNGQLDRQSALGNWSEKGYPTANPTEGWFAWVNQDDFGLGMYVPGITRYGSGRSNASTSKKLGLNSDAADSSMLTGYRPAATSPYTQCYVRNTCYTAPIMRTTMDAYTPLEYTYVIRVDYVDTLRNGFQSMDLQNAIDNSGLKAWDD